MPFLLGMTANRQAHATDDGNRTSQGMFFLQPGRRDLTPTIVPHGCEITIDPTSQRIGAHVALQVETQPRTTSIGKTHTMTSRSLPLTIALVLSSSLLSGCIIANDGDDPSCPVGKCDGVEQSCSDPRYNDGVCNVALDCAVPDIDCFRTFNDDDAGAAWFTDFEARNAVREGRPPRAVLAPTDPRFAKVRALLDRGWEAMRKNRPVGLLGDARPALVFVEDPSVNAFVMPDDLNQKRASLAVMVHTGTLAIDTTEDANLGLMMHELQHAVGLHVIAEVKASFSSYYVASETAEPIGRRQVDDRITREAATAWLGGAAEIGPITNVEVRGMPLGAGALNDVFLSVAKSGVQANPAGCARSVMLLNQISSDVAMATDLVSGAPHLDASMGPRVTAALTALRVECMPNFTMSFVEVLASIAGVPPEQIDAQLTPADRALVTGKHIVDAIALLGEDRRAMMRSIEAGFQTQVGRPWSNLRFFSTEEDADDASVPVLRAAGLEPTGLGTFFLDVFLPRNMSDACKIVLATGAVPSYGVNLADDHHSTCWRVYHLGALAAETAKGHPRRAPAHELVAPRPRLPITQAPADLAVY